MNQRLMYVMGPSGAGKDSLLDWLKNKLPPKAPIHFAKRTIDRPLQALGEQHESVDSATFERLQEAQSFAMHWHANGRQYGVRARRAGAAEAASMDVGQRVPRLPARSAAPIRRIERFTHQRQRAHSARSTVGASARNTGGGRSARPTRRRFQRAADMSLRECLERHQP